MEIFPSKNFPAVWPIDLIPIKYNRRIWAGGELFGWKIKYFLVDKIESFSSKKEGR